MAWRGIITEKFRAVDPSELSESERRTVLDTFDEVADVESASIVQQLAACFDENQLSEDDIASVRNAFNDINE